MTEYETISVYVKFKGSVKVKVPVSAPAKKQMANFIALERIEAKLNKEPDTVEGFYQWCDIIDPNMDFDECNDKYGSLWDSAKTEEYANGIWELDEE